MTTARCSGWSIRSGAPPPCTVRMARLDTSVGRTAWTVRTSCPASSCCSPTCGVASGRADAGRPVAGGSMVLRPLLVPAVSDLLARAEGGAADVSALGARTGARVQIREANACSEGLRWVHGVLWLVNDG